MNEELEKKIIAEITAKKTDSPVFNTIVNNFEEKLSEWDCVKNCFEISKYFGEGLGKATAIKKLLADKKIQNDWLTKKDDSDFKGIYVFLHNKIPFYVGISRGVIDRILQHVKGRSHNSASMAYKIALIRYEILNGKAYSGERADLDFDENVEPIKNFLMAQEIAFLPIECDVELYLFEVFCATKFQTILNTFETH